MRFKKIKTNKKIKNKTNKYLFMLVSIIVLSLSVGYSAINSDVTISGEANFRVLEDLRITDVTLYETTYNGEESYRPKFAQDTLTLGVDLKEVESTVTYKIELTNYGTVGEKVSSINVTSNNNINTEIELIDYNSNELIYPATTKEIYVKVKYKTNVEVLPEITTSDIIIGFTYIAPTSTLATNFRGNLSASSIESVEFLPTLQVGEDAIAYWDASYNHDNMVVAWYTDEDSDNLYELYLGGNGKTYAPADSGNLFKSFNNVTSISFGNYFDTTNVTSMQMIFNGCSKLTSLDLSTFNTENVTSITGGYHGGGMFYNCSSLESLDLTKFNTKKVTSMSFLFQGCGNLSTINFGNDFDTSKVKGMQGMFSGCSKLVSLDVTKFNTSKVTNMSAMFSNCSSLTELDVSNFDTSNVTNMGGNLDNGMFGNCSSLTELDVSNFDTSKVTNMQGMFGSYYATMKLKKIVFSSSFVTSNVTNMENMFHRCTALTELNISNFDTSKVTNMQGMFYRSGKLVELDLSNFNTSKVTNMVMMFTGCGSLTKLDIRNFDFSSVTAASQIFNETSASMNIIVKSDTERDWILNKKSSFTNIQTVTEL